MIPPNIAAMGYNTAWKPLAKCLNTFSSIALASILTRELSFKAFATSMNYWHLPPKPQKGNTKIYKQIYLGLRQPSVKVEGGQT
jgi:hypothetical protein